MTRVSETGGCVLQIYVTPTSPTTKIRADVDELRFGSRAVHRNSLSWCATLGIGNTQLCDAHGLKPTHGYQPTHATLINKSTLDTIHTLPPVCTPPPPPTPSTHKKKRSSATLRSWPQTYPLPLLTYSDGRKQSLRLLRLLSSDALPSRVFCTHHTTERRILAVMRDKNKTRQSSRYPAK